MPGFGKDAFWSMVGNIVTQGLSFCSTVIVARLLTKQDFGGYAIFLSSVALLGTLAGLGLGIAISTTTAELRDSAPALLGRRLAAAYWTGGAVTLCLSALVVVAWAVEGNAIIPLKLTLAYLALVIVTVTVNAASGLQAAELVGYQSFRSLAAAQCVRGIALVPLCATGAVVFGLAGVISALIAASGMSVVVQALVLAKERKRRGITLARPDRQELTAVLSCSLPAFGATVAQAAGFWGGNVAVAALGPGGVAAVAEYGAASQVNNIILFVPNIIGQVLMPTVAHTKASDPGGSGRLVRVSLALNTGAAILLGTALVALRRPIALLFGPRYAGASVTMGLIGLGAVVYVAQSTLSSALIGYGHIRAVTLANTLAAVAFICAAGMLFAWAPRLGSQCLGWAYILSSTVQLLVNATHYLRRQALATGQIRQPALAVAAKERV